MEKSRELGLGGKRRLNRDNDIAGEIRNASDYKGKSVYCSGRICDFLLKEAKNIPASPTVRMEAIVALVQFRLSLYAQI